MRRSLDSKAMIGFRLIGLLAVAVAALVAVGCGSADEKIPSNTARTLDANLTTLKEQIAAVDCTDADETLNAINTEADTVSGDVGSGLRKLLTDLNGLFEKTCPPEIVQPSSTTDTTSSSSSSTTSDTTDTSTSTSTETSTSTDSSSTSTTDSTSTDTTPPGGGGGTGGTAPGGNKRGGS